ncbi:MAG: PAS domain S-box protein [Myxococcota bacterium]|nr:PAS domain S-box protein [Myxococcota bacterium]
MSGRFAPEGEALPSPRRTGLSAALGPPALAVCDTQGHALYTSQRFLDITGWAAPDPARGQTWFDIVGDRAALAQTLAAAVREGHWQGEYVATSQDGSPRVLLLSVDRIDPAPPLPPLPSLPVGSSTPLAVSLIDITEIRRLELALADSERRYQTLATLVSDSAASTLVRTDGTLVREWAADKLLHDFGYTWEDIPSLETWATIVHPADRPIFARGQQHLFQEGFADEEYRVLTKRDEVRWIHHTLRAVPGPGPGERRLLSALKDVTEQKQAELALQESEERFRSVIDNTPNVAIEVFDLDGRVLFWNPAAARLFGIPATEAIGATLGELILCPAAAAEFQQALHAVHASGEPHGPTEWDCTVRGGGTRKVYSTIFRLSGDKNAPQFACIDIDISERVRLEEQLLQAQKMESLGRLTGGIAHDFNNLLTPILGHAELLLPTLPEQDPRRAGLQAILQAGARARDLTQQLLAFARKRIMELAPLDLREVLQDFVRMLQRTIREDIRLDLRLPSDVPLVRADRSQLTQVLMNLVVNALDAMPEGGVLRLELAAGPALLEAGDVPGVRLWIIDTGIGMEQETLDRLFEPFFTTKESGKGTGLGLATAYGIVQQHGGTIRVTSSPGQGSAFEVLLPALAEREPPAVPAAPAVETLPHGGETILVVEDDEMVRAISCEMLQSRGYRVIAATGPDACLALPAAELGEVDLLLTDVVMPGMNGRDLATRLTTAYPGLRVVYMSGYDRQVIAHEGWLPPGTLFLPKPFDLVDLVAKIHEALRAG